MLEIQSISRMSGDLQHWTGEEVRPGGETSDARLKSHRAIPIQSLPRISRNVLRVGEKRNKLASGERQIKVWTWTPQLVPPTQRTCTSTNNEINKRFPENNSKLTELLLCIN